MIGPGNGAGQWRARCAIVALFAFGACSERPLCDPELKLDTTYVATVGEIYGPQSSAQYDARYLQSNVGGWPSCSGFDGVVPSATITIRTTDAIRRTGTCRALEGVVLDLPTGETWRQNIDSAMDGGFGQSNIFFAIGRVVTGNCQGDYMVSLGRPFEDLSVFSTTNPGALPNMVLGRSFSPSIGEAGVNCRSCTDTFVAQLALGK